ncbi:MAG: putative signal peptide protein [Myxococcales bacterium]|nr:putative signal peptide protein [Myxococcales bacterium]
MRVTGRFAFVVLAVVGCHSRDSDPCVEIAPVVAPPGITPMRMIATDLDPARDVAAPWTLTASDGSGLQLTRVDAKAVVQGPLAFTELHLYFHNPEARIREGTFAITLPSGAAVSRFAIENNGQLQEAEVVEKSLARRAYDDLLHRKQDPALLEKAAGNQFSARVFPIAANADKHIILSFSQELAGRAYTLPLRGLPNVARVDVALAATRLDGSRHEQVLHERDWLPDHDFMGLVPPVAAAVTSGSLVAGALAFVDGNAAPPSDPPKQVTLLVDTSASRGLGFASYVSSIHALIDAMRKRYGDPFELQVIAFDQDSQPIFDGAAADYGQAEDTTLLARGAAGASNIAQVIEKLSKPHRRVVIVTDGVVTAGPATPALVGAIKKLPIDRLDVVLAGGIRDERLAASIARAGLPHAGDVYDLDRGIQTVAAGLGEPVMVDVAIEVPGALWVYPKTIPAARPGSSLMVYARMPEPTKAIDVVIGGTKRTVVLGTSTPALIERAVATAEIEELENALDRAKDVEPKKLRDDIAKRSVRARVISSQASMLVLETKEDYARFNIDRRSLTDILVVGPSGIEQLHRATIVASKDKSRSRPAMIEHALGRDVSGFDDANVYGGLLGNEIGEANGSFGFARAGYGVGGGGTGFGGIGMGSYGTIGHGSIGGTAYGAGAGRGGMRGHTVAVPSISVGQPMASGDLDQSMIRRYIKRHINKISYCYEKQLLARPTLAGSVSVSFMIAPGGFVEESTATGFDTDVASCIAAVIKQIEFPKAENGGRVLVHYPLTFRPAGSSWSDPSDSGGRSLTDDLARADHPAPAVHDSAIPAAHPSAPLAARGPDASVSAAHDDAPAAAPAAAVHHAPAVAVHDADSAARAGHSSAAPSAAVSVVRDSASSGGAAPPAPATAPVVVPSTAPSARAAAAAAPVVARDSAAHASSVAVVDDSAAAAEIDSDGLGGVDAPALDPDSSIPPEEKAGGPPLTGKLAEVMNAIRGGKIEKALRIAKKWHDESPGDVLALVALGETLETKHDRVAAARTYGSIIDLFPSRADLRRFAGERLERLGAAARPLVIDTYRKAVADRPDHVTGHRLLAYALVRKGDYAGAFAAILAGIDQKYPEGRFLGADRVLGEDAGMIAAVYLAHGANRDRVMKELTKRSLALAEEPSTRFIMYWETDANDVDFHIRDSAGGHAWYSHKELESGGELYADITTGYGPECFAIRGTPTAGPYRLSINYYSQGPMGYGMGLLQIQRFDGKNLVFEDRPYVIMTDQAFVDLGTY